MSRASRTAAGVSAVPTPYCRATGSVDTSHSILRKTDFSPRQANPSHIELEHARSQGQDGVRAETAVTSLLIFPPTEGTDPILGVALSVRL